MIKAKRLSILLPLGVGIAFTMAFLVLTTLAAPGNPQLYPVRNNQTAPRTITISITYNEPLSATTVTSHTFAVYGMQTGLVTATHSVHANTIVVTPTHAFHSGELVEVVATTHTLNITGETPADYTLWQFRVGAEGGAGYLGDTTYYTFTGGSGHSISVGDVDRDGDIDALIANDNSTPQEIWLNDGHGGFGSAPHDTFGSGSSNSYAVLGDVDGDGDLDAVVSGAQTEVWLNDGQGNFGAAPYDAFHGAYASEAVVLGDVNGDGNLDAVVSYYGDAVEVWLNDGQGDFGSAPYDTFMSNPTCGSPTALGDMDGDGDLDAVVGSSCSPAYKVWLNDSHGDFGPAPYNTFGGGICTGVSLGDLDRDGDLDVMATDLLEQVKVWVNNGLGQMGTLPYDAFGTANSTSVALGDVNGDGKLDAVIGKRGQAQEVWLNNGQGDFGGGAYFTFGSDVSAWGNPVVALGDVDDDGDLDVIMPNYGDQTRAVWLNQPWSIYLPLVKH
jgi:hypothetical protein